MRKFLSDPKPDIFRIQELVIRVKAGDIKLPKFQRPFVWNRENVLNLWDSVYNGYPIGSVLLWLTKQRLASEKRIGDLEINNPPDEYPTNYVLDGQQRLSTLCGALYWNGTDKNSTFNVSFDLKAEKFLWPKDELRFEYFPLRMLLDTSDFLKQCKLFQDHPEGPIFFERAESLLSSVKDYKLAAVTIGDMELSEVAPIFERINSTGRKLTIYDLMRAATWSGDFDLNDSVKTIRDSLQGKSFEKVPETHILRNISASAGYGINKLDIDNLRKLTSDELRTAADDSVKAYQLAVDFLTAELPIPSHAYLPYALQLTHLVEFFRLQPKPTMEQREKLRQWMWRTSLSGYFRSANTTQNAADLAKMQGFAKGESDELELVRVINPREFIAESFALNKAVSKAFALLLASNAPKSLLDGSPIDIYQALAVANRHEFHHIFPQAYLKSSSVEQAKIDLPANICLLNKGNNLTISSQRPSVYFGELESRLGDKLESVLESNFISVDAFLAGLEDDYDSFLKLRSEDLVGAAKRLAGFEADELVLGKLAGEPTPETSDAYTAEIVYENVDDADSEVSDE